MQNHSVVTIDAASVPPPVAATAGGIYYNENDPKAAAWLRELIRQGHIPAGDVDERSIVEVKPNELTAYIQCHFFAGIGGWPYALALAGWPVDRPVWTGSCPCQPFSAAGKGLGTADERHLWPVFANLIRQCQPPTIFGEQVASKAGREWLAGVFADLEGMGYQRAGADLCAAGVGAPHIRQRLFWVAHAGYLHGASRPARCKQQPKASIGKWLGSHSADGRMGNAISSGECGRDERGLGAGGQQVAQQDDGAHPANQSGDGCKDAGGMGLPHGQRSTPRISGPQPGHEGDAGIADHTGDSASTPPPFTSPADGLRRVHATGRTLPA